MNDSSEATSHSEMISSDDSSEKLSPLSSEEEIEFIKMLTILDKLKLKHGEEMQNICKLGAVGIRDNAELILAHLRRIISVMGSTLLTLKEKNISILGEEGTSKFMNEADETANKYYSEWLSDQIHDESDQSLGPTTNQLLSPTVLLSQIDTDNSMSLEGSESMSRDSMSTEGDECESVEGSCKRRLNYSSEQQKKRSRRTAADNDANTSNRVFAQKERELERRREEIEIRERALAAKEKQLSQQRQAAAEESSRKMTLEEKTRLEHQQKLDVETAEAEKRLLQIQQETKAEAERLEKIQQAKAEAERKAEDNKFKEARVVIERRLVESRQKIEEVPSSLDTYHVVVVAVSLLDAVIRKVEDALEPRNPNFALIPKITNDLIIVLQVIARYKKMLGKFTTKKEARSIDTLLDISVHQSIGAIAARIEKNKADKEEAINYQVPDFIKHLKYALHRFKTGDDCTADLESQVTSTDINRMKAAFPFDQAAENLLLNCSHLSLMVYVEEALSVEQLFENLGDKGLCQAEELWKAVLSEAFNATEISMLEYRQKVLLPALANEKLREDAVKVNCDFANCLTDLRIGGRKEIVRPAFANAQRKKFDGSDAEECKEDYCAGPSDAAKEKRYKMTLLQSNLSARDVIQKRLPADLFPGGLGRALLLNSTSFCKRKCNFVSHGNDKKPGFFQDGHDIDNTAKEIRDNLKYCDSGETNIIIDREEKEKVIGSLKSLFG